MGIEKRATFLPFVLIIVSSLYQSPTFAAEKSFIVYLGAHSTYDSELSAVTDERITESHYELLGSFLQSKEKARDSIFYSYTRYINGFAAILEEDDAVRISQDPRVVSVFPNRGRKLHTTRSWRFLGLEQDGGIPKESLWSKAKFGEDVIIANLDTGVWPESASFRDDGMGPIPARWKGICQKGSDHKFNCNRKLIGARYFNKGFGAAVGQLNATFNSPRDNEGHGTHTLSTAGGGFVPGASVFGYGNGTAKGGSPRARVAAYKVCWPPIYGNECYESDILAGFEAAIKDGVDVLSVSLGGDPMDYFNDGIAVGSFHAVANGVTVVASAGNSGPAAGTVSNLAPWLVTVGASTMDREFPSYVSFGRKKLKGESLSAEYLPKNKLFPLIHSQDAKTVNASTSDAELCLLESLDPKKAKGKIIVCMRGFNARVEKGVAVKLAGGAGMVLVNDESTGDETIADAHVLPATHITFSDGLKLLSFLKASKSPLGTISRPRTSLDVKPAPFMAAFSSVGPNPINPEILKANQRLFPPDITAPGVSVIAAFTEATSPTDLDFDKRRIPFNAESGTSMSCPHIAGIAGLLKSSHPEWSPSAIKSAIITTARTRANNLEPINNATFSKSNPFGYGAGQVRPNRADDPGLVYDMIPDDYLNFLCAVGYNSSFIAVFKKYNCPTKRTVAEDLNYPTITIPNLVSSITVTRRLKNVGLPGTYTVRWRQPMGVDLRVEPRRLTFAKKGEEKTFTVKLTLKDKSAAEDYVFGWISWSDGKHDVKSPVTVKAKW
ncbi:Subtilisin-like protease [Apostasia shenzhenica]|uniref:Subtilisin-like protease n=1 Tax=Apostasia shenzhenica TaxID=1088818 RepID=A0A2I0ASV3_9ASPA|nr:Subtilisin-like protease [Apostasia shenzhenica]